MNQINKQPEWLKPFPRRFVNPELAVSRWEDIAPYYEKLAGEPNDTPDEMEKWLADWSELKGVVEEFCTRRYVDMTCHTDDNDKTEAYLYTVREVEPKMAEWEDKLNRKYMASPAAAKLSADEYGQMDRMIRVSVELFDEKNIPLSVQLAELSQEYQALIGGMMVDFDGKERTMPEMRAYLNEPNRNLRERAYKESALRRLREKTRLEDLFDKMLELRDEVAKNLGLPDYREYCFKAKLRDYTPDDCLTFHSSIERKVVPLVKKIADRRKKEMGLDHLAPWDMSCDTFGRPPLRPFVKARELFEGVRSIFGKIDDRLGEIFDSIGFSMDLESRKGKAPGGYQTTLSEARIPFIFTNAVGTQDDVNTLLHEGGHAFHSLEAREQPMIWNRHAAMEFCEVASMSMELAGERFVGVFYKDAEDMKRAKREKLEGVVTLFPWIAQVDAFQHWIYIHPGHSREQRVDQWVSLTKRFASETDWSQAPEGTLEYLWHRQLHIFELPFYYIEYAIAQLGALQVYRRYKTDHSAAIGDYLKALSLGGRLPVANLFDAAGIRFDFSPELVGELMDMLEEELEL